MGKNLFKLTVKIVLLSCLLPKGMRIFFFSFLALGVVMLTVTSHFLISHVPQHMEYLLHDLTIFGFCCANVLTHENSTLVSSVSQSWVNYFILV